ncbi:MAG: sterol desaturase family protein [Mariprofundaceae bacterium]|nr:sterol desaturase family protein [Mariprofundaceae bacterium]
MTDVTLIEYEGMIRLLPFFTIFMVMALLEIKFPRRILDQNKALRWWGNLSLVAFNTMVVRVLFIALGTSTIAMAWWVGSYGWGLLPLLHLPVVINLVLAVLLMDLVIYWQHRLFHTMPWLWRLHRVHHADRNLDVSSGLRFHPLEIVLSLLIKLSVIVLLGAPALAVVIFEVVLNGMAMFNHANVRLPLVIDIRLRYFLMTPDAHRIHHSTMAKEYNSNYGFNLSWWDRCFGSYRTQPEKGQLGMSIGLPDYQNAPTEKIIWMLRLPWKQ